VKDKWPATKKRYNIYSASLNLETIYI
jgi:hypothetical protein